ncbi:MAG: hypothetical protein ACJ8C4_19570 [Gemmataceae bacterium]
MKLRAVLMTALIVMPASAQVRHESHVPIPPLENSPNLDAAFQKRRAEILLQKLLQDKGSGKLPLLAADPAMVQDLLNRLENRDPELLAQFRAQSAAANVDSAALEKQIQELIQKTKSALPSTPPSQNPPSSKSSPGKSADERFQDMLRDWKLDEVASNWRNSQAYRDLMQEISRAADKPPGPFSLSDVNELMGKVESLAKGLKAKLPESIHGLPKLHMHTPDFGGAGFSLGQPSLPSASGTADIASIAIILAAVGFAAWFLWRVGNLSRRRSLRKSSVSYTLRDPEQVTTREELIDAFERLALVFFGSGAAHWHHRRVADRLAEKTLARSDANELAELYERARYSPAAGEENWQSARPALARLARGRQ